MFDDMQTVEKTKNISEFYDKQSDGEVPMMLEL